MVTDHCSALTWIGSQDTANITVTETSILVTRLLFLWDSSLTGQLPL